MDTDNTRPKRIVGLKAIAEYLSTSPRNIYRWEKELGFPLHRIGGSKGRSVFVDVDELEEWLKKTDLSAQNKAKRPKFLAKIRHLLIGGIILILILVFIHVFIKLLTRQTFSQNPVTYDIFGKMVNLINNQGKTLWSYQAWQTVIDENGWTSNLKIDLADIDGDGFNEVIAAPYDQETNQYSLTLYDHQGKIIWSQVIKTELSFQGLRFVKDFIPVANQFTRRQDGSWLIVAAWRHNVRFVAKVMTISPEGEIISEFSNPGHLSRILITDVDNDGEKEILFSGTHNLLNGDGILLVLPLTGYSGITPPNRIEPEYNYRSDFLRRYIADNVQLGQPKICIRFRKPPYLKELIQTYAFASINSFSNGRLSVYFFPWNVIPHQAPLGFLFIFDSNFNLVDVVPESVFIQEYNNLALSQPSLPSLSALTQAAAKNVLRWVEDHWEPVSLISLK